MIGAIASIAYQLDHWLKLKVGRLYTTILIIGLVGGIVAAAKSLAQAIGSTQSLTAIGAVVVFQLALLVNQLAQFHEYRQTIRSRREERRRARAGEGPPQQPQPGDAP